MAIIARLISTIRRDGVSEVLFLEQSGIFVPRMNRLASKILARPGAIHGQESVESGVFIFISSRISSFVHITARCEIESVTVEPRGCMV